MQKNHSLHWAAREAAFIPPPRREDMIVDELDDEAILLHPDNGDTFRLNRTALAVWQGCNGRVTNLQIAWQLVDAYDVDIETAADHVDQLLTVFTESGLLSDHG